MAKREVKYKYLDKTGKPMRVYFKGKYIPTSGLTLTQAEELIKDGCNAISISSGKSESD